MSSYQLYEELKSSLKSSLNTYCEQRYSIWRININHCNSTLFPPIGSKQQDGAYKSRMKPENFDIIVLPTSQVKVLKAEDSLAERYRAKKKLFKLTSEIAKKISADPNSTDEKWTPDDHGFVSELIRISSLG